MINVLHFSYKFNLLNNPLISILTVKTRWSTPEPAKEFRKNCSNIIEIAPTSEEKSFETLRPVSEIMASLSTTPTPSLDEDDDEFDDESDKFSFYNFSILHFLGNITHTHITQRLKQPLLPHDDEGDALVRRQRLNIGCFLLTVNSKTFYLMLNFIFSLSSSGMSDFVVDYSAVHGGPTRTKISRCNISSFQHHVSSSI